MGNADSVDRVCCVDKEKGSRRKPARFYEPATGTACSEIDGHDADGKLQRPRGLRADLPGWTVDAGPTAVHSRNSSASCDPGRDASISEGQSLNWLNEMVKELWPRVNKALQKYMHEDVTPMLQQQLPATLKKTFFETFTLGDVTPVLGPVKVFRRSSGGLQLILGINYQSEVAIKLSTGHVSLGINSVRLTGDLHICLEHLMDEAPVIGGLMLYFLDPPELDYKLEGLGGLVAFPGLGCMIRNTIDSAIANALVLPNCCPVPFASENQGVSLSLLNQPKPLGVLRLHAVRAFDLLAADIQLIGAGTSDPYVRVKLADDKWRSSTRKKTLNPVWGGGDYCFFLVYNREQKLSIDVFDEDFGKSDDRIGRAIGITVGDVVAYSERPIPLFHPTDPQRQCGTLELKFICMSLSTEPISDEVIVTVKVGEVLLPKALGEEVALSATLGSRKRETPWGVQRQGEVYASAVTQTLRDVVQRCKAESLSIEKITRITGLGADDVTSILNGTGDTLRQPSSKLARTLLSMQVDSSLYFPSARSVVGKEVMALALIDGKGKEIANYHLHMASILSAPHLVGPQTVNFSYRSVDVMGIVQWDEIVAQVQVSILGLQLNSGF